MILGITEGTEILVAQTKIKREVWSDFPIILEEKPIVFRTQVALCVRRTTGLGIGIDPFKNRCVIGEVPKEVLHIQRSRRAAQVVVVLLVDNVDAQTQCMAINVFCDGIAEIKTVFSECRRRSCPLRRAKSNAIEIVAFDLDAWDSQVHVLAGGNLIEVESREIYAEFIYQCGRDGANPRSRLDLIERLYRQITLRAAAAR